MRGSLTVVGEVLDVSHRSGEYEGRQYDFHLAEILCGTKVVEVKFQNGNADARPPAIGDTVTIHVELPKGTKVVAKRYASAAAVKSA